MGGGDGLVAAARGSEGCCGVRAKGVGAQVMCSQGCATRRTQSLPSPSFSPHPPGQTAA